MIAKTDQEIILRVLAGEKRAFAELVDRHKGKAMTLAMRMLGNREDAEEALQDAFVRAFHALPRFEWKASFSTWFYRILYNVCATALGKRGRVQSVSLDEEGERKIELPSEDDLPDRDMESSEFRRAVMEEIENLPEMYAAVISLFFVQERSYEQIVEITGMPLGTVKVRLFRARSLLRAAVAKRLGVKNATGV